MIEIDRLPVVGGGRLDELVGRGGIERKMGLEDGMQLAPLGVGEVAIERGDVHQESGGGAAVVVRPELLLRFVSARELGEELFEVGKHGGVLKKIPIAVAAAEPGTHRDGAGLSPESSNARPCGSGRSPPAARGYWQYRDWRGLLPGLPPESRAHA